MMTAVRLVAEKWIVLNLVEEKAGYACLFWLKGAILGVRTQLLRKILSYVYLCA
jgi:hypothetical protein